MARRLSGLQKDVLSLYRKVLREALKKDCEQLVAAATSNETTTIANGNFVRFLQPQQQQQQQDRQNGVVQNSDGGPTTISLSSSFPSSSSSSTQYACQEFRRQAKSVKRSDFKRIEYMIRKGEKQVKLLQMPGVKVVSGMQ